MAEAGFCPVMFQIMFVLLGKTGFGVQVRTVLLALQASTVPNCVKGGTRNRTLVLAGSIASLKVKTTAAEGETHVAKFAGTLETSVGCAKAIGKPISNAASAEAVTKNL